MSVKNELKRMLKSTMSIVKKKQYVPIPKVINGEKILKDKVALITGGTSGIGYAIAESFISAGARVIIAGTNEKKLQDSVSKLCKGGGS